MLSVAECYCGNSLVNGAAKGAEADCNMGCSGNPSYVENNVTCSLLICAISQACGGPNRVSVYSSGTVTALAVPSAQTTNLPGQWTYKGCLRCVSILELTFLELLNLVNDT